MRKITISLLLFILIVFGLIGCDSQDQSEGLKELEEKISLLEEELELTKKEIEDLKKLDLETQELDGEIQEKPVENKIENNFENGTLTLKDTIIEFEDYDVVDYPMYDKDEFKVIKIYYNITNTGDVPFEVDDKLYSVLGGIQETDITIEKLTAYSQIDYDYEAEGLINPFVELKPNGSIKSFYQLGLIYNDKPVTLILRNPEDRSKELGRIEIDTNKLLGG